jgi:flagellar basal body rod protein FlgC
MESLKSMLMAVSELRAQTTYMRDVAEDLVYAAQLRVPAGTCVGQPLSLVDVELGYDFREYYMPGHPSADERGYVTADEVAKDDVAGVSEEAQAAYQAYLQEGGEPAPCADSVCDEPLQQTG